MHLDLILYVQLRVEVHRDVFSNREYGVGGRFYFNCIQMSTRGGGALALSMYAKLMAYLSSHVHEILQKENRD